MSSSGIGRLSRLSLPPPPPAVAATAAASTFHLPTAEESRKRKQAPLPLWQLTQGLQHMITIQYDSLGLPLSAVGKEQLRPAAPPLYNQIAFYRFSSNMVFRKQRHFHF